MTSSPALFKQARGTSSASVVTFFIASSFGAALIFVGSVMTATGALTRSKIVPRLTANGSWRCPTNIRAGIAQPGMFTVYRCLAA